MPRKPSLPITRSDVADDEDRLKSGLISAPWDDVVRELNRTVRGWLGYFSYGTVRKARHAVQLHLSHTVRRFLRRRHKIAGSGYRRFPMPVVFGELGVVSPLALPGSPLRMR